VPGAELGLSAPRVIHIVGIGGAGMSGIATVLTGLGHRVSGSDLRESPTLDRLRTLAVAQERISTAFADAVVTV